MKLAPRKHPDVWFLIAWACFVLILCSLRQYFTGDGVRHVGYVLSHRVPALGEARWLLFPSFLFVLLRPFYVFGIVHTTEGALVVFALASGIFSIIYLLALRVWLVSREIPAPQRALALAAAALCPAFLNYSNNPAEPLFAATFSAVGLAIIARTGRLPLGVLLMSVGLLLHQTVFIAFFMLPMAVAWQRLRNPPELGRAALVVAAVTSVTFGILMAANHIGIGETVKRILQVYRNPIHQEWMRGSLLKGVAVTVIGSHPQALIPVPGMHGMRAIISGVRHADREAMAQGLRLVLGFALVALGVWYAIRRKRWEWLVALGGFSILPIVWNNVYGYAKFYLLFPLLVAQVVARAPLRAAVAVVVILGAFNLPNEFEDLAYGRNKAAVRRIHYRDADATTRWITSGWDPDLPYLWPGKYCAMLRTLAEPSTAATLEELRAERTGEFMTCVREAFCSGGRVWTDDWLLKNREAHAAIATYHGLSMSFVDRSWWRGPEDGAAVDVNTEHALYIFSPERQREICAALQGQPAD